MVVGGQRDRLLPHLLQVGLVAQIQADGRRLRLQQLAQAQFYPIDVGAMILQGQGHRLFNQVSRVVQMQLQHPNKLAHSIAVWLPLL